MHVSSTIVHPTLGLVLRLMCPELLLISEARVLLLLLP
jgi:hypothetical protein